MKLITPENKEIIDISFVADFDLELTQIDKTLIIDKLLEAHNLAKINVKAGNITKRGFATNVCDFENNWSLGTNFNNTRNDISSICGERSAILSAYNNALIRHIKTPDKKFEFKIKYLCMASSMDFSELKDMVIPCEDCLSWLNTNRYFDDSTLIFTFSKLDEKVVINAIKLAELLPYKHILTSQHYSEKKEINYSKKAKYSIEKLNIKDKDILNLVKKTYEKYKGNKLTTISNQNIACSILVNDKIYCATKLDWTKRWHIEPLELAANKAIKENNNIKIKAISYFGDEFCEFNSNKIQDGVVSIKALGRIRQKYANNDTLIILNLKDEIKVVTLGEFLPHKFEQGYKII